MQHFLFTKLHVQIRIGVFKNPQQVLFFDQLTNATINNKTTEIKSRFITV